MKFRNLSSVTVIINLIDGLRFDFCRVSVEDVVKEIKKFSLRKPTQSTDVPVKILKDSSDIFENYI